MSQFTNCNCRIHSICQEHKQPQSIMPMPHIHTRERSVLSLWTGNCYSWNYLIQPLDVTH